MRAHYSRSSLRLVLAVFSAAGVAALGGVILGEYPFTGVMPYASGIIFALVISEVLVTIGQRRGAVIGLVAAVCTVGGLGWAVWISSGRGVAPVPTGAWLAIAVGVIVALGRGGFKGGARSTARTPDSP